MCLSKIIHQRKYYILYNSALDTYLLYRKYRHSSTQYNVGKPDMHYRVQNRV